MALGGSVLVVDDEASLRLLCRVNLELGGFAVHEAATLTAARTLLDSEPIDVAVLDVHIAGEDGRDLLDELRAAESPVRVAILTGSADLHGTRMRSADAVVGKPFDPEELVRVVRELVAGARVDSST
jgi:DNA-binding response OmpR family regulator